MEAKAKYYYTDTIWKKEKGPCTAAELAKAKFKNRISWKSPIRIEGQEGKFRLDSIPEYKQVRSKVLAEWTKLLVIFFVSIPIMYFVINWFVNSTPSGGVDWEEERKAEEWLSDPVNREHYNKYMRERNGN